MAEPSLDPQSVGLIAASALLHAGWNLLLKRAGGSQLVVALSKVAEALVFAPFFLWTAADGLPPWPRVALLVGVAATGVLGNYIALAAAYRRSDLSLVYPVSRGAALVFLPVLGALFLGERLGARSVAALALIIAGIVVLQLPALDRRAWRTLTAAMRQPAIGYAVLAAFLTATYTVWDKVALREMAPFAYMYLYTVVVAAAYGGWVVRHVATADRQATWRAHRGAIVGIGVMNMLSYGLTLLALQQGTSSLVIGLRQLSIVAGVFLGWVVLRERITWPRRIGVAMIATGCVLIAIR
ncbi:MAG: EamA family transporter [Gemmatimonadetes bacterium]|nr:EamA family transporter [Gemmatimonadota bacterium]